MNLHYLKGVCGARKILSREDIPSRNMSILRLRLLLDDSFHLPINEFDLGKYKELKGKKLNLCLPATLFGKDAPALIISG